MAPQRLFHTNTKTGQTNYSHSKILNTLLFSEITEHAKAEVYI